MTATLSRPEPDDDDISKNIHLSFLIRPLPPPQLASEPAYSFFSVPAFLPSLSNLLLAPSRVALLRYIFYDSRKLPMQAERPVP